MGYYSTAKGKLKYSPSLPLYALKGNQVIFKYVSNSEYDLFLDPEYNDIFPPEDSFKAYWIKDNLIELVSEILKINPGTLFRGYIEIQGEGDGTGDIDLWRLLVKDGRVVEVSPKLVWPEDAS